MLPATAQGASGVLGKASHGLQSISTVIGMRCRLGGCPVHHSHCVVVVVAAALVVGG